MSSVFGDAREAKPSQPGRAFTGPGATEPQLRRLPSWPAVSIVLLLVVGAIFPPGLLTAANLYLLLFAIVVWVTSGEKLDTTLARAIAPFGLIIVFGLAAGIHADRYLYLKDAWYLSNPPVIMSVGYVLYRCKADVGRGLRAFVIGGTLVSMLYLSSVVADPEVLLKSADEIRGKIGAGYVASALAFTILCAYFADWAEGLRLPRWLGYSCLFICGAAIVVSFSRTTLVVAVIGVLAAFGAFARREWLRIGAIAIIGVLLLGMLRLGVEGYSGEARKTFVGKLARSMEEIAVAEYTDLGSINDNWRGYETAMALKTYSSGSALEWIIGHGFGAEVDLGLTQRLGRVAKRYIPILHNGYAYLLVKGGAIAVALYVFALAWLYWVGRQGAKSGANHPACAPGRLLQAVALCLAFTTWVISGAFNKGDALPFLLAAGFLLGALTRAKADTA